MKNNLRKGVCCLTCVHRVLFNARPNEIFCNLDKSLDIKAKPNSSEQVEWKTEHFVEPDDVCDDFQKDLDYAEV